MIDIIDTELTIVSYLFCQIAYFTIILLYWKECVKNFDINDIGSGLLLLVILFCVLGFENGDFYGYQSYLKDKDTQYMEPIYGFIAEIVSYNYFLFRLVVWGGAILLFYRTAKRFKINPNNALFILFIMFISTFDYARASLAMSVYYYGLSFLCIPIRSGKYVSYLYGLSIIFLSFFFHNSMIICILIAPTALIRISFKKLLFFLLAFLLLIPTIENLFFSVFDGSLLAKFAINDKILTYENLELGEVSFYEWIRRCFEYMFYFIPILFFAYYLYVDKNVIIQNRYERLFIVSFFIMIFAIGIIVININFFVFFYRYLFMLMIPVSILVCYARSANIISQKLFVALLYMCMIYKLFSALKTLMGGSIIS